MDGLNDTKDNNYEKDKQEFPMNFSNTYRIVSEASLPENFSKENLNVRPSGAMKNDAGKPRFSLLPIQPVWDVVDVLEFGAKKYGSFNWHKGFPWLDLLDATQRHLAAWQNGEDNASDSNLNHLAHAACNLMFLLEFRNTHSELDNRLKK
jgi:Domain of unknown function (DUF5664)